MKLTIYEDSRAYVEPQEYVPGESRCVTVRRGDEKLAEIYTTDEYLSIGLVISGLFEIVASAPIAA